MRRKSAVFILLILTSCTISFQNISTHGTATDVIDEDLKTDPQITSDLKIPVI